MNYEQINVSLWNGNDNFLFHKRRSKPSEFGCHNPSLYISSAVLQLKWLFGVDSEDFTLCWVSWFCYWTLRELLDSLTCKHTGTLFFSDLWERLKVISSDCRKATYVMAHLRWLNECSEVGAAWAAKTSWAINSDAELQDSVKRL